jgi:hypothetical protein
MRFSGGYPLKNLENLMIIGSSQSPPEILQPDFKKAVLDFRNVRNLFIQHLKLEHLGDHGCIGGVIHIQNGTNITLDRIELRGSGFEGLYLDSVNGITVSNSLITQTTGQLSTFYHVQNGILDQCQFLENRSSLRGFIVSNSNITFKESIIRDRWPFFEEPYHYKNMINVLFYINDSEGIQNKPLPYFIDTNISFIDTEVNGEIKNVIYANPALEDVFPDERDDQEEGSFE